MTLDSVQEKADRMLMVYLEEMFWEFILFFYSVHANKSLICVPMNSPGVHLNKRIDKMGMRCSDTALIYFDDVRVPASNIIGEPGEF